MMATRLTFVAVDADGAPKPKKSAEIADAAPPPVDGEEKKMLPAAVGADADDGDASPPQCHHDVHLKT